MEEKRRDTPFLISGRVSAPDCIEVFTAIFITVDRESIRRYKKIVQKIYVFVIKKRFERKENHLLSVEWAMG